MKLKNNKKIIHYLKHVYTYDKNNIIRDIKSKIDIFKNLKTYDDNNYKKIITNPTIPIIPEYLNNSNL